jgi:hypothetical protein
LAWALVRLARRALAPLGKPQSPDCRSCRPWHSFLGSPPALAAEAALKWGQALARPALEPSQALELVKAKQAQV